MNKLNANLSNLNFSDLRSSTVYIHREEALVDKKNLISIIHS